MMMIKIELIDSLIKEIKKNFSKAEANKLLDLFETLKESPHKGKPLYNRGALILKELKYKSFRFYFITDGFKLRFLDQKQLKDLLIKFVAMSDKNQQQTVRS